MKNVVELYCIIDEVVKQLKNHGLLKKACGRKSALNASELITIAVLGHLASIPTNKLLYDRMSSDPDGYFCQFPCYAQFTRGLRSISPCLDLILQILCQINVGPGQGFYIVDSTALPVNGYNPKQCPKWASDTAKMGKNIYGYYNGFKLHIIINRAMDVVSFFISPANVHDVRSLSMDSFTQNLRGILVGDKGYVASQETQWRLKQHGLTLLFKQRKNMDPFLNIFYRSQLRQRQVIEGVFSYLKNRLNLLHRFARSSDGFLVHVKAALLAFMLKNVL